MKIHSGLSIPYRLFQNCRSRGIIIHGDKLGIVFLGKWPWESVGLSFVGVGWLELH